MIFKLAILVGLFSSLVAKSSWILMEHQHTNEIDLCELRMENSIYMAYKDMENLQNDFYQIADNKTQQFSRWLSRIYEGFDTLKCHEDNLKKLLRNLSVILNNADPYPFVDTLVQPLQIHEKLSSLKNNIFEPIVTEARKYIGNKDYEGAELSHRLLLRIIDYVNKVIGKYSSLDYTRYLKNETEARDNMRNKIFKNLEYNKTFCNSFNDYSTFLQNQSLLPLTQFVPSHGLVRINESTEYSILPKLRTEVRERLVELKDLEHEVFKLNYKTNRVFMDTVYNATKDLDGILRKTLDKLMNEHHKEINGTNWDIKIVQECENSKGTMIETCKLYLRNQTKTYEETIEEVKWDFEPRVEMLKTDEIGSSNSKMDSALLRLGIKRTLSTLIDAHREEFVEKGMDQVRSCCYQIVHETFAHWNRTVRSIFGDPN